MRRVAPPRRRARGSRSRRCRRWRRAPPRAASRSGPCRCRSRLGVIRFQMQKGGGEDDASTRSIEAAVPASASSVSRIASTSKTQPPQAAARVLQRRPEPRVVGQRRVGRQVRSRRARRSRAPSSGSTIRPASPTKSTRAFQRARSITISDRGRRRAACRSARRPALPGETWPMQAPVETPLKRASVSTRDVLAERQVLERRR